MITLVLLLFLFQWSPVINILFLFLIPSPLMSTPVHNKTRDQMESQLIFIIFWSILES